MFSGHKVVCYCNITKFGVATPSRHRDLNIFRILSQRLYYVVALLLLRSYTIVACPALTSGTKKCLRYYLQINRYHTVFDITLIQYITIFKAICAQELQQYRIKILLKLAIDTERRIAATLYVRLLCTDIWPRNQTYAVVSTPIVTGSVFCSDSFSFCDSGVNT